jgi:hypothetical protein
MNTQIASQTKTSVVEAAVADWEQRKDNDANVKMYVFYRPSTEDAFGDLLIAPCRPLNWFIALPIPIRATDSRASVFGKVLKRAGTLPLLPSSDKALQQTAC